MLVINFVTVSSHEIVKCENCKHGCVIKSGIPWCDCFFWNL